MAYDKKFRRRVIKYKDAGHTFAELREAFGVRANSYYAWKKQLEETGAFKYNYPKEHKGKIDPAKLMLLLRAHPDWYLSQFAEVFGVWPQAVQKRFVKMGITYKNKLLLIQKNQKKREKTT